MPSFDAKDKSRYETFSRRTLMLTGGMTAVFGVLAGRLYQLQIVQGDVYMTRAEDNRVNQRLLAPPRGRIFDRFGTALATNRRNNRALIVPEQAPEGMEAAMDALAKVIPLKEGARARVLKEAGSNKSFVPILVAENLAWEDFARLNLDLPYLPGVQPDVGETRDYPFGDELSHVLGYVAAVSPEDKAAIKGDIDPLLDLPGFRVGKRGIEKAYDDGIRGRAGASRVEVNAYGRVIRELGRDAGQPGDDVYLTIDRELQHFAFEKLRDQSAACVVMDVDNGDVLALVSAPGFDPNLFNVGIGNEQWATLTGDDHKPLLNKVMSGVYPPGSTFKTVTALAALQSGAITPDFTFNCTGKVSIGSHDFHCWRHQGHGRLNLHEGLKYSCDCYFYEVSRRLGIDQLGEMAKILGFGSPTGIELPGERSGFIPDRAWKKRVFKEDWQLGETLIAGIGQGFITASPLQLATLAARIAGGRNVSPRIVHSLGARAQTGKEAPPLAFSAEALAAVRDGMNAVSNEPSGTAYGSRIVDPQYALAGKTGTAQVRRISREERASGIRRSQDMPWHLRDHALFIAFAPVAAPRYAISLVIEHGNSGSGAAAPFARDILTFAQTRGTPNMPTAYPVSAASAASPQKL